MPPQKATSADPARMDAAPKVADAASSELKTALPPANPMQVASAKPSGATLSASDSAPSRKALRPPARPAAAARTTSSKANFQFRMLKRSPATSVEPWSKAARAGLVFKCGAKR